MCKCHLADTTTHVELNQQIITTLSRMQTMKKILACDSDRWEKWQNIQDTCQHGSPETVVMRLVTIKEYCLAREVADQYQSKIGESTKFAIEESFLSHLLTVTMDYGAALQALVAMGQSAKTIVTTLLGKMEEFSTKLFLVQVLLTSVREYMNESELELYTSKELGVTVVDKV